MKIISRKEEKRELEYSERSKNRNSFVSMGDEGSERHFWYNRPSGSLHSEL